jgi:hypothetical protein
MWDQVRDYDAAWWRALPGELRVVAFSDAVAGRARDAGLRVLRLRYAPDPDALAPAPWDGPRTAFYWNRTGLAGPRLLERLCRAWRLDRLLFRGRLDPGADPAAAYALPPRLGRTTVETVGFFDDAAEYQRLMDGVNVYLAPRAAEGVGLTFLEALARGCAVLALDAPTMNEYIRHGQTGLLLQPAVPPLALRRLRGLRQRGRRLLGQGPRFHHPLDDVPPSQLQGHDPQVLGRAARRTMGEARQAWLESLDAYAAFLAESP